MIELLLPAGVAGIEAFDDDIGTDLFAAEATLVRDSGARRRFEFTTARRCAREALSSLGCPPGPILAGPKREPIWPPGFVGSITHCRGYRGAAVARSVEFAAVGIDAEPHGPVPAGVLDLITVGAERASLADAYRDRPSVHWDRLLFSAKESVYKAWYPLAGLPLEFREARVEFGFDGTFQAEIVVASVPSRVPVRFHGRWLVRDGLILTAVVVAGPGR